VKRRDLSRKHRAVEGTRVSKPAFASCQFAISDAGTALACGREQRMGGLCASEASIGLEMGLSYTSKRIILLDAC
jgi:hypothetical protein